MNNVKWDLLYVSAIADFQGPFVFVSFSLSASLPLCLSLSLLMSLHFVKKIMQLENTSAFVLNCKTTLMCTAANSLWLSNLPFSQTFQRGGWKLCAAISGGWGRGGWCVIERTGSYWQRRVEGAGVHCPHDTRRSNENTKHLKCINFSASDRATRHFSGWCQKSWALRSLECNFTELPP